jgi:hypothetical protein
LRTQARGVVEAADPVPIPVGDQKGLLGELLGHRPAPQQPTEQSHHLGILPQVEDLERLGRRPGSFVPVGVGLSHLV